MQGILLLVGAALLWSTGGLLIKLVDLSPMAVSSGRSIIAAAVLMLLARRTPDFASPGAIRCGYLYALTVTSFVVATKLTTAANAIVIQYTAPIFVALLSWRILGERVTKRDWMAIALVTVGMVVFFADGLSVGNNLGNATALISGACFAALVISLRQIHNHNPSDAVVIGNCLAFLVGLPWLISSSWTVHSLVGITLLGVFQLGLSYFLYTKAIKHVTALEAVLIPVIEPLLNPVWVYLMMGEAPSPWALMGGGIILSAVTWRALATRSKQARIADSMPSACQTSL
jgi:drug/metabolite transporter (DMT)-like permease